MAEAKEIPDNPHNDPNYKWYFLSSKNVGNMKIKGRKGKKYLSIELRVPLDPFTKGKEDLDELCGIISWGVKNEYVKEKDDES